jgi:hypothetical protein
MEKFTTKSTSYHSQIVNEPIIIDDEGDTRKVFIAEINDAKLNTGETVSGTIVHQRKNRMKEWESVDSINLNTLKGGEGVKLKLRSAQIKKLYDGLTKLYTLSSLGVNYGKNEYIIGTSDEVITVSEKRKEYIEKLLQADHGEEIWRELIETQPNLATKLAFARIQSDRKLGLVEFEQSLNEEKTEEYWQDFFSNNDWIFGYGLNYKFLTIDSNQPNYGGEKFTGKGKQKGDYLTHSESNNIKFTVLVEIKKPTSLLLAKSLKTKEHLKYRNGAWLLGSELLGGVSQVQVNCKSWQKSAEDIVNKELIENKIYTVRPKGILVIGNTSEFENDIEKITSFELFRQSINNVEIVTFDELCERAKFIIGNLNEDKDDNENEENEYPF